jgi:hypothetical protein
MVFPHKISLVTCASILIQWWAFFCNPPLCFAFVLHIMREYMNEREVGGEFKDFDVVVRTPLGRMLMIPLRRRMLMIPLRRMLMVSISKLSSKLPFL